MPQNNIVETKRLLIKPTSEDDAALIYQLMNTPKFIENVGDRQINSIEAAKKYIRLKMLPQLQELGFSSYTLITKADGFKIGTCGLYNRDGVDGIDIGFGLLPQYERKGFAFEAAHKIKNLAFTEFGLKVISAITTKTNIGSQKLLEKLGLKLIGTTKIPNDNKELLLYKIEKESIVK